MPPWRRCSRLPDVLVSLAEGPPGRADLARRRAITLQAGSHTGGPGTRSGPLQAIAAGQAARNGLCRPPGTDPDYEAKKNRVLELYAIADDKAAAGPGEPTVVICLDEF